jgi:phosphopantetheinyl transferase
MAAVQTQVMGDYFDLMRDFLAQQAGVVAHWQPVAHAAAGEAPAASDSPAAVNPAPFLDEILELDATRLRASCRLSVHRDAFLRDHVLSGRGSDTDPDLIGLACVPLMVSLEIMAEACAVLAQSTALRLIEQVKAFDWIALDDGDLALDVVAEAIAGQPGSFQATLRQNGADAVTARFAFAATPVLPLLAALGAAQPPRWDGAQIYDIGMFHGPIFQSLQHITGWNGQGIDCQLTPCSLDGFFATGEPAHLVLNPVLLDAMGQLAACWVAEHVGTDFNCFPSTIERIELLAPVVAGDGMALRGRQRALDPAQEADVAAARRWDFEAVAADGAPLVRVAGLVNVFFHVPHRFYQVRRDPLGGWLGAPLQAPGSGLLWQLEQLPEDFCAQSNGIFLRMLALATLSFEERELWRQLPKNVRQRRQWLLGRLALKEATRYWWYTETGQLLFPSDIEVHHDAHGHPAVGGWWSESAATLPQVSLTHDAASNIALLSASGEPVGVDAELIGRVQRPEALAAAFTAAERTWLEHGTDLVRDEAVLRLWCAKEAAAKLLGTGLRGAPEAFEVSFEPGGAEHALVHCDGMIVAVMLRRLGNRVLATAEGLPRFQKVH